MVLAEESESHDQCNHMKLHEGPRNTRLDPKLRLPMTIQNLKTAWMTIDKSTDPDSFVRFMDTLRGGKDDDPDQYRAVFDLLSVSKGERILDIGCGTGGAVRALAPLVGDSGRVVGVDNSATMIKEAQKRSAGSALPVEYKTADAHSLPFDDNAFDGSFSLRAFEILQDPRQALVEMVRVTRPGGRIFINGPDIDMWAIDATDRDLTRKIVHYICDHETNGLVGRQLPGWCNELGLNEIAVVPLTSVVTDFRLLFDLWLGGLVERAQRAGAITEEEANRWINDLESRYEAGKFFCSQTVFRVIARKP